MRDVLNSTQTLTDQHIQYFMYQLLLAVYYMHSADILHRVMKPENILLNNDCELKLCDFGLSRGIDFELNPTMSTNYVQTRWYRAPELLLNNATVSKETDMWSVGCIMAELVGRRVMFQGKSPIEQMKIIVDKLGTPQAENIKGCAQGIDFVSKLPFSSGRKFKDMFPQANPLALDLLKQLLQFNHEKRMSAFDALHHPYFKNYYDERDVLKCESKFDFSFEDNLHDSESIKREMYNTILEFEGVSVENDSSKVVDSSHDQEYCEKLQTFKFGEENHEKKEEVKIRAPGAEEEEPRRKFSIVRKIKGLLKM